MTDKEVGEVIARLKKEGILDDTVVFFMTDHGISHARGKQFLYDEGIHVPFVVRGPGIRQGRGARRSRSNTSTWRPRRWRWPASTFPRRCRGATCFAKDYKKRDAVFAARDRCDETIEHLRSVRTEKYKYIRNYLHERPHLQPNRYKDDKAIVQEAPRTARRR